MSREELVERMNKVVAVDQLAENALYVRTAKITEWSNYGKSRTYFKLTETSSTSSKHYKEKDFGYFDNINNVYVPGKDNLESNRIYGMSGTLLNI